MTIPDNQDERDTIYDGLQDRSFELNNQIENFCSNCDDRPDGDNSIEEDFWGTCEPGGCHCARADEYDELVEEYRDIESQMAAFEKLGEILEEAVA